MELKPLRISSSVDDNHDHGCLPVFLRIRPREDQEQSIKVLNGTTVETTHGGYRLPHGTFSDHLFEWAPPLSTHYIHLPFQLSERTRKLHTPAYSLDLRARKMYSAE